MVQQGQQFKQSCGSAARKREQQCGKGAQSHGNVIRYAYVSIKLGNLGGRDLMEMIALLCACHARSTRTQSQNNEPSKTSRLIYCASYHCTTSRTPWV